MHGGAHRLAAGLACAPGADNPPQRREATLHALRARINDPFGLGESNSVRGADSRGFCAFSHASAPRRSSRRHISTGLAPLDAALPAGGLPAAALTELLSATSGAGAFSLALHLAARVQCADQRTGWCENPLSHPIPRESFLARCIVVVDPGGDFYAPAAAHLGLDPQRLIVLRLRRPREALWATEQALRCTAVAAVVAPFRQLDDRDVRRLQLAAERGGALGLLLRPSCAPTRTFAAARILVERACTAAAPDALRCAADAPDPLDLLRLTVLKVRDGFPSAPLTVDLHHETGDVSVHPVPVDGSEVQPGARRTG